MSVSAPNATALPQENRTARQKKEFSQIIGSHPSMINLFERVDLVAKTDVTVHIYGENGTGKELIADSFRKAPLTRQPFSSILTQSTRPINPVAPVIKTVDICNLFQLRKFLSLS